jgi:hypothetical protein
MLLKYHDVYKNAIKNTRAHFPNNSARVVFIAFLKVVSAPVKPTI